MGSFGRSVFKGKRGVAFVGLRGNQPESRMPEIGTSGLIEPSLGNGTRVRTAPGLIGRKDHPTDDYRVLAEFSQTRSRFFLSGGRAEGIAKMDHGRWGTEDDGDDIEANFL